jgi:hypothetical protein
MQQRRRSSWARRARPSLVTIFACDDDDDGGATRQVGNSPSTVIGQAAAGRCCTLRRDVSLGKLSFFFLLARESDFCQSSSVVDLAFHGRPLVVLVTNSGNLEGTS